MRAFAKSLKPGALVTCNNSLNSPDALFSQIRTYGYDISQLSRAEDYVLVEDMKSQPRVLADGRVVEYGPTYSLLQAVGHGRPLAAVTIADDDYHTPPNLVRLAMAEAAANRASYVLWAAWPEAERPKMIAAVRPQVELLRRHAGLLNETRPRRDVALFLPFRRWLEGDRCVPSELAAELVRRNIPFEVVSEEGFGADQLAPARVLLVESLSVLTPAESAAARAFESRGGKVVADDETGASRPALDDDSWISRLTAALGAPSLTVDGPATVRAYAHDQPDRTIVHLLNLNVRRLSSFEDAVTPTGEVRVKVRVPFAKVRSVTSHTADERTAKGRLNFVSRPFEKECRSGIYGRPARDRRDHRDHPLNGRRCRMSCYLRHLKEILDEAGIEVDPGNKKRIDSAFHQIAGVIYKDCPATWKALKETLLADEGKRRDLVKKLKAALR